MEQVLKNGIIFGQTAFKILKTISESDQNHNIFLEEIHIKVNSTYFDRVKNGCLDPLFRIKKISNCKVSFGDNPKYFLYMDDGTVEHFSSNLTINTTLTSLLFEDILDVQINSLLQPIIELRRCKSINEALMNWSLNNIFIENQDYFNHKKLISSNMVCSNAIYFKKKVWWFLKNENIQQFVPKKFLQKVEHIHKSKKTHSMLLIEFMDIVVHINQYFLKMVRKYYKTEHVQQITSYDYSFPIELYGNMEEINHPTNRKSLYLVRKNKEHVRLKSFAILFNLRWFFNTRYNYKKSLGFDKEYGKTVNGYAQTFHKYDDVLLWLITHPNTVEEVEFVVLDPIPPNYIFSK